MLSLVITGATEMECETLDEVMSCLERGSTIRRTACTQMNEYSSRSHAVFSLLIGRHEYIYININFTEHRGGG